MHGLHDSLYKSSTSVRTNSHLVYEDEIMFNASYHKEEVNECHNDRMCKVPSFNIGDLYKPKPLCISFPYISWFNWKKMMKRISKFPLDGVTLNIPSQNGWDGIVAYEHNSHPPMSLEPTP